MMDKNYHLPGTPDDFIKANMKLAQKVAWGWIPYVQRNENIKFDKDDLLSIAYIGLIKAYEMFNPDKGISNDGKGIKFSTYAVPTINGYIRKFIRDNGNTIRKSRDGTVIPCDSLDTPIGDDGSLTVGDMVHSESYEIENQVIIKDFLSQIEPRLQRLYKLWRADLSQREIGKSLGISQVQVSRLIKQLLDLAGQYGGQPKIEKIGKGGIWKMATDNTKRMRAEITTLKQFYEAGGPSAIVKKYGVASPTAYTWKRKLSEIEVKEVSVIKEDAVKMETTSFEIANILQVEQDVEIKGEGTGIAYEASKPLGADNHTEEEGEELEVDRVPGCFGEHNPSIYWCNSCEYSKECLITANKIKPSETKDDLIGIVESEPPWKAMDQIDRKWTNIETELMLIRMLYKEKAVEEFRERLAKMMEGM